MDTQTSHTETLVEMFTGVALVAAAAVFFFTGRLFDPLSMLVLGGILLASGIYQTSRGWHVAATTWLLGIVLALGGLGLKVFVVSVLRVNWLAIALILIAAWWVYNTLLKNR